MLRWFFQVFGLNNRATVSDQPDRDPFEFSIPFDSVIVSGRDATRRREELTSQASTAVVMGDPSDIELLTQLIGESTDSVDTLLNRMDTVDIELWNASQIAGDEEYYSPPSTSWPSDGVEAIEPGLHLGTLTGKPKRQVVIGIFETGEAWQVPAHVRYGNWNECPPPELHCALHRIWARRYGAEIISMSNDVIECRVKQRPASKEEAIELARQQFLYCPDIVHQGVQSLEALAAILMISDYWYFWWD